MRCEFDKKSAGMETPAELLSMVSILFKRSLTGKRHHVVL
jgi:hypothetical protein